jgi:hypothetical protein
MHLPQNKTEKYYHHVYIAIIHNFIQNRKPIGNITITEKKYMEK